MASKKPKTDTPTASLAAAGLENYQVVEIHRRELKNAAYNPRTLNDSARRRLKAGLKRHGLVAPVTWNARTGHIVGGHQRTSIMDALMGTSDYTLSVAKIDVPPAREKELNVLLNNSSAMGDWDLAELSTLLADADVDITGTGFDAADVYKMFGDSPMANRTAEVSALAEQLSAAQDKFAGIKRDNQDKNSQDFYLVVVFKSQADLDGVIAAAGLPDNRYQSGEDFKVKMGLVDQDGDPIDYAASSNA